METKSTSKAEYFIQQLNANNAKKVALLMVIGFIVFHGLIHLRVGSDSCKWLLSDGRLKRDREWQPYGCMLHQYTETDTRRCLRYLAFWGTKNQFVFIGDTRIRVLYQAFVGHLQSTGYSNASVKQIEAKHMSLEYSDPKLKLNVRYIFADEISKSMIQEFTTWQKEPTPPMCIIASCTYSKFNHGNFTDDIEKAYITNLTRLIKPIEDLASKKTKIIWKLQDPIDEDKLEGNPAWKNVLNEDIEKFNQAIYDTLGYTETHIWSSSKHIAYGLMDEMVDGYRLGPLALKHDVQILLNMYCNDYMNYNDGTCCSSAEPYTTLQIVTYAVLAVCCVLGVALWIRRWWLIKRGHTFYAPVSQNANSIAQTLEFNQMIYALATLAAIMGYFYLCDRTNFFMKENKYYSEFSFWIPVGYVFVLGLFFTEDSKFTKVLHRDQTDELKGWMQLVILIYYMTGASRVIPIYMHIKVLISTYLFLSGYGHWTYTWQTGNCGIVRFFQVMFRLNFLTVLLCFCMNRPYQFYFFVPLVSFWVCVIYLVLSLPPRITSQTLDSNGYPYFKIVAKFVCTLAVITILYMSEVFFERIFVTRPWKALFVTTDDDIKEWWYRFKLDRYTIIYGMIFAVILHLAQKYNLFDDNNHTNLFSRRASLLSCLFAFMGIGFYTTYTFLCRNKQDCEEIHPYVSFIPIVSYIVLRNLSGILRTRYSTFFSWFGHISLELFICQYHIWLAADRHGVLVLMPGFPTFNLMITSFIFVCVSHEVNRITLILSPYIVPNDWKLVLRNFAIFLVVLLPIARHDGMF